MQGWQYGSELIYLRPNQLTIPLQCFQPCVQFCCNHIYQEKWFRGGRGPWMPAHLRCPSATLDTLAQISFVFHSDPSK